MWNSYRSDIGSNTIRLVYLFLAVTLFFVPQLSYAQAVFPDELLDSGSSKKGTTGGGSAAKKDTTSSSATKKIGTEPKTPKSQPYVRMFFERPGTEIELFIDPSFSDVNLDIELQQSSTSIKTEPQESVEDKVKRMLDSYLKPKEKESEKAEKSVEEKEEPKQSAKKEEKKEAAIEETSSPDNATTIALSNIHRAQKFFYARNFNQALVEVRNSLDKKETALGYALQGSIYFQMGQRDAAVSSWRSALALDPNMREVRDILRVYEYQQQKIVLP